MSPIKGFLYRTVEIVEPRTLPTSTPKKLIKVTIEARKNSRALFSCCGKPGPIYDTQKDPRAFDYIPLWNIPVRFYYRMRSVDCRHCQHIITEAIPWASGKHRHTNDLRNGHAFSIGKTAHACFTLPTSLTASISPKSSAKPSTKPSTKCANKKPKNSPKKATCPF